MCGITGYFSPENLNIEKYYHAHLKIRHRGPDDEGFFAKDKTGCFFQCRGDDTVPQFASFKHIRDLPDVRLVIGHRRLSILDVTYHGHQPMGFEGLWLVYNGEIYNYLELREELQGHGYSFLSDSDTEVVLKAFHCWGVKSFERFNGMWALAIYNENNDRLVLSRDRFGIKPLYYVILKDRFVFGSEIKFFFPLLRVNTNENRMIEFASVGKVDHEQTTMLDPICQLPPGSWMQVDTHNISVNIHRYWDLKKKGKQVAIGDQEAIDHFKILFDSSIDLRMRSDVPVGTLLSGGLDSTSIVCNLYNRGKFPQEGFHSYSAVFSEKEYSERREIEQTVELCKGLQPHWVEPSWEDVVSNFDELISVQDFPIRSLAVLSHYMLYKYIHLDDYVTVLLNGQGADEMFAGYSGHFLPRIASGLSKGNIADALRESSVYGKEKNKTQIYVLLRALRLWVNQILSFQNEKTVRISNDVFKNKQILIPPLYDKNPLVNILQTNLQYSALPEYLRYEDRNSMAFSRETRLPFLDYRIVEFAFSLTDNFKIRNGVSKWIQRQGIADYCPPDIVNSRIKKGFVSPQEKWQKAKLSTWLREMISSVNMSFVDSVKLKKQFDCYLENKEGDWALFWRIACLNGWLQHVKRENTFSRF